jgi:hypothetical protein
MIQVGTDLLNLLELVDSEDTPCVLSVRSGLFSEACRVSSNPVDQPRPNASPI